MLANYKQWFRFIPVAVLVGVLVSMWGCGPTEDLVAKVGNRKITADQFREFLVSRYRAEGAQQLTMDKRLEALNQQIEKELIALDGYRQGLDRLPEAEDQGKQASDQMALEELFKREIVSRYINEAYLRDMYDKQGEEVQCRHILLRVANRDSIEEVQAAKQKIEAIEAEIAGGADFAEVATAKSEDETTSKDGGNLGFFVWGRMVDEFQEAAYALKVGEVSKPVLSDYGWHLIKLEERRAVPNRGSFEEERPRLEELAQRMMGETLRAASLNYVDSLKESRGLEYDTVTIALILGKLNDKTTPKSENIFDCFTEGEKQLPVARYGKEIVTLDSLGKTVMTRTRARSFPDQKSLTDVVDGIVVVQFLVDQARKEGIYDLPRVKQAAREAKEAIITRQAEKTMVDDRLDVSDESLLAYYEEQKSEYFTDPERTVREIFIYDDENKANRVAARARKGDDFLKLTRDNNEKKATKDNDGIVGPFKVTLHGQMGKEAFALEKVGDIAGPIQIGKNYSIIRLEEILPPRQKTFGEAKNQIRANYRRGKRTEIRDEWLSDVRKKNPVKIYESKVAHLFPEDDQVGEAVTDTTKG